MGIFKRRKGDGPIGQYASAARWLARGVWAHLGSDQHEICGFYNPAASSIS